MYRIRCRRRRNISFFVEERGESFLGLEEILVEGAANGKARPVQAALECRLAQLHDLRGVLGREPLDVAQDERGAVLGRQRADRILEDPADFSLPKADLGRLTPIGRFRNGLVLERPDLAGRWLPGRESLRLVEPDPVEPGEELRPSLE